MLILRKFETGLLKEERAQKKTSNYTAMLRADYVQLFQLLFHLFVCFGFDLSSSFNSSFVHLCAYAHLWVEFFWSQRNNDIGHMISIAIIQLLPKRAAFILFISAPLFALFLSLSLTVHCNGFLKSMLFCQFCWRFYFLLNFSNIFCVLYKSFNYLQYWKQTHSIWIFYGYSADVYSLVYLSIYCVV